MPRKKATIRDQQIYKLAAYGAIVTIDYDVDQPPPFFQPAPGVVIVGEHLCNDAPRTRAEAVGPEATGTLGGATMDDVREFQKRRDASRSRPLTSEDVARESGFPAAALS